MSSISQARRLLQNRRTFLIAEVSCNHMGNFDVLQQSIDAAFSAGADAVKLQSSEPECLTRNFGGPEFKVDAPGSPWDGMHLYNLYERTCTPIEWPWRMIRKYRQTGNLVFSTPFSPRMVDLLEAEADPELYKVSSIDWNHVELIERCLRTGKPVLVSMVKPSAQLPLLREHGVDNFIPMYCVSRYPAQPEHFNMRELAYLAREAEDGFGFSDHSVSHSMAALAVAHGAMVIEKHFKRDATIESEDAAFSVIPTEFAELASICGEVATARQSAADVTTIPVGRSIYVDKPIRAAEVITRDMLCIIRPGGGLPPTQLASVIGRRARIDLEPGVRLKLSDIV